MFCCFPRQWVDKILNIFLCFLFRITWPSVFSFFLCEGGTLLEALEYNFLRGKIKRTQKIGLSFQWGERDCFKIKYYLYLYAACRRVIFYPSSFAMTRERLLPWPMSFVARKFWRLFFTISLWVKLDFEATNPQILFSLANFFLVSKVFHFFCTFFSRFYCNLSHILWNHLTSWLWRKKLKQ